MFVRDVVPSALAFMMGGQSGEDEIIKNFILKTLIIQSWADKKVDDFHLAAGTMPASFKVVDDRELKANFGETAIGRVALVDSGLWWIILLRAYTKKDPSLANLPQCQHALRLIIDLCLAENFEMFPTLLCSDGCCMIDRRMGIYGHPIEIQALFFMALRCALPLLKQDAEGNELMKRISRRLHALS